MKVPPEPESGLRSESGIQGLSFREVLDERTSRRESIAESIEAKSDKLNSVAQVTTQIGKRPTVMFVGRKFNVQSRWPERPVAVLWRKLQDR
jgi:hypothetical protein